MGDWGYLYVGHVGMEAGSRAGFVPEAVITSLCCNNSLGGRYSITAGSQCFPHHACPLYWVVLMQLHC